jgi:hypothetical protein
MVNIVLVDHLNLDTGILKLITTVIVIEWFSGADSGFKVRGAHLKKLRRAEGGAKISDKVHIFVLICIFFDL